MYVLWLKDYHLLKFILQRNKHKYWLVIFVEGTFTIFSNFKQLKLKMLIIINDNININDGLF